MYWQKALGIETLGEGEKVKIESGEYVMERGILRQKELYTENQSQTMDCFGFKWEQRDTYESEAVKNSAIQWLTERYLGDEKELLDKWLFEGARILDAGCGSGFSSLLLLGNRLNRCNYLGTDISTSVDIAAQRFDEAGINGEFLQADLSKLPFSSPCFDLIFSEGVLHHTDSTEESLKSLARLLVPGGHILFYVYKRKSPIREFVDDYIRGIVSDLNDEQAWDALLPLTQLGQTLGNLNLVVDVPADIPYLGISAGPIDIQRLFYWHIFKAFYKPEYTVEEMNHVNFDWYRPANCHRHTPEELQQWCQECGIQISRINIQESGITIVGRKS